MIILLLVISLVIFTDFIPDPVTRYNRGYTMLYIIGFSIFVNIAVLIYSIVSKICTACRSCFIKRRKQKAIAQLALKKKEVTTTKVEASNIVLSEIIEEKDESDDSESDSAASNLADYNSRQPTRKPRILIKDDNAVKL